MTAEAPRSWAARAALLLGSLLLTALLLEGGARLVLRLMGPGGAPIQVGWQQGEGKAARVRDLLYEPDPELFFRLAPNLDVADTGNPRIFDLHTDSRGLRSHEATLPKPPGTYRVLAVGDSCTFGSGAAQAETWPAQLERRLTAARPDLRFEVLNAGVPGFTSHQALRYLELEGFDLEPDAVIFTTGVNDASPATAGGKRRFGAGRLLSDREYAEAIRAKRRLGLTRLLWRAGLVGSAAGDDPSDTVKRRVPLPEYGENLASFAEQSRARGVLPVIVAWPLQTQSADARATELEVTLGLYQRGAAHAAEGSGATFVDLLPALRGRDGLYVDVVHLGPEGYGVVASAIAAAIDSFLPLAESRIPQQFQGHRTFSPILEKSPSPAPPARPLPLYRQQHPLPKSGPLSSGRAARLSEGASA